MNTPLKRWLVLSALALAGILIFTDISAAQGPFFRRRPVVTYSYAVPNYQAASTITYYPYGYYGRTRGVSPYLPYPVTYSYYSPYAYSYPTIAYNNTLYNMYYAPRVYSYPYYTAYPYVYGSAYSVYLP